MFLSLMASLAASKDGDELCEKIEEILIHFGISMFNLDGTYKDTYTLLCEIAEVMNREK